MKKIFILMLFISSLISCAVSDSNRYDSNSDRYKRMYGIHQSPPRTTSGPNGGNYYKR